MRWFVVLVAAFAVVWAAFAYLAVAAATARFGARSRAFAAAAASIAGASVAALLAHAPAAVVAVALPPIAAGHPVACTGRVVAAKSVARGYVDQMRLAPDDTAVADGTVLERNRVMVISGWATDAATRRPLVQVCAALDGALAPGETAAYGIPRPDVAAVFKNGAITNSGFELRVQANALAPGEHALTVVGIDASGRDEPLAPSRRIVIPPS